MTSRSEHKEVKSKLDEQCHGGLGRENDPIYAALAARPSVLARFEAPICPQQGDPYSDELRVKAGTSAFTAHQVNLKQ